MIFDTNIFQPKENNSDSLFMEKEKDGRQRTTLHINMLEKHMLETLCATKDHTPHPMYANDIPIIPDKATAKRLQINILRNNILRET